MKYKIIGNKNYCATIKQIKNIVDLENCDNIKSTNIFGNNIIISKDIKIGDIGVYFPTETEISSKFLHENNLYRDKSLNKDSEKIGFFETNGRVKCVKFRGHKSEGFWLPITCLNYLGFKSFKSYEKDFDTISINGVDNNICKKYIIKNQKKDLTKLHYRVKKGKSKLIENQFRLHKNTPLLGKHLNSLHYSDLISITKKLHGTSAVSSYLLCKKKVSLKNRIAKLLGFDIKTEEYDYMYSSRKVIKNKFFNNKYNSSFNDIWTICHAELKEMLTKGMTIYYEIVGYLDTGKPIQGKKPFVFDYGCDIGTHDVYIYRITTTNEDGKVLEWSMRQIDEWTKCRGLKSVPILYYGFISDWFRLKKIVKKEDWREVFLNNLKDAYLEKKCSICNHSVPDEGVCLRVESIDLKVYKLKSFKFKNLETTQLDEGLDNIEENEE